MPRPLGRGQRYMPGLDGLRAIAVAVVIAYHLNLSWAPGGLLGVGIFFTLSGYLITDLLLGSWEATGRLRLRDFWLRRARRLLPALFVMLAVVTTWVAIASPSQLGALRGNVLSAVFYVNNWWLAIQHVSYFARFGPQSPLGHLWSLSVEEQFYLLWPWLVWAGLIWLASRQRRAQRRAALQPGTLADNGVSTGEELISQRSTSYEDPLTMAPPTNPGARVTSTLVENTVAPPNPGAPVTSTPVEERPTPAVVEAPVRFARSGLWPLAGVTVVLAVISAIEMGVLYHPTFDPSRVYDGTDTRAFGLLFGAALAMVWPSRGLHPVVSPAARRFIDGMGALGLLVLALLIWRTGAYSAFLYRGGLVLVSLATCLVVAAVVHPGGRIGKVLGVGPLRWTGVRSYGIYLWHYPVIVLTTATVVRGTDLARDSVQVAASVIIAALSWRFIESPIRKGALGRLVIKLVSLQWGFATIRRLSLPKQVALGCVPAVVLVATLSFAGVMPSAPSGVLAVAIAKPSQQLVTATTDLVGTSTATSTGQSTAPAGTSPTPITTLPPSANTGTVPGSANSPTTGTAGGAYSGIGSSAPSSSTTVPTGGTTTTTVSGTTVGSTTVSSTAPTGNGLRTSCTEVAHLGDSTSESLISANYLPDPSQRLGAQYARVGVRQSYMEIVGANSIVETLPGDENGYQLAKRLVSEGYRGCWVIALGTNDIADISVGSSVNAATRIQRMMSVIGNEPVLWVNVKTLLTSGPYAEPGMQQWNAALLKACPAYPNMRVFNWAGMANPKWFISDGIHYTSAGSAARAAAIADALATAFPAEPNTGASPGAGNKQPAHQSTGADHKSAGNEHGAGKSGAAKSGAAKTGAGKTGAGKTGAGNKGVRKNTAANCEVNGSPAWDLPTFQS